MLTVNILEIRYTYYIVYVRGISVSRGLATSVAVGIVATDVDVEVKGGDGCCEEVKRYPERERLARNLADKYNASTCHAE